MGRRAQPMIEVVLKQTLAAAALALCLLAAPGSARAVNDPSLEWFTIETPRFVIHYHSGLEQTAARAAALAEDAHLTLAPLLDWAPGARTHMVITDQTDSANGSARVVPYNLIRLLGFGPTPRSTLNDFDDWLRNLIYHEYVHILHLDTISGWAAGFNALFGKAIAPNGALPKWYIEGLATYYESQRTGGGRVRSALFNMYLRTAALQGSFFSLDRLNGAPLDWPQARAWYLYGSFFIAYLASLYGEQALTAFNHRYGDRLIPFAINETAREVFGADFPTLYARWEAAYTARSLARWITLRASGGPTPVRALTHDGYNNDHLRWRPGHPRLSFFRNNGHSRPMLSLIDPDTGEVEPLFEHFGDGWHDWSPDGEWMVFAEIAVLQNVYYFHDLFRYWPATGRRERLTWGARGREPSLSPDGRHAVFIVARDGTTDLARLDLETGLIEVLYRGQGVEQLATPDYLPDGARVVVSRFVETPAPQRDLFLFHLDDRRWQRLTDDQALALEPQVSLDGRHVVYTSDRDGIFAVHALDLETGQLRPLTRTISGHLSPQLTPDGAHVLLTLYTEDGHDVAIAPLAQPLPQAGHATATHAWVESLLERPPRPRINYRFDADDAPPRYPTRPYRPWRYMWPRSWLPEVDGLLSGADLRLLLTGGDPVGLHAWTLRLSYFLESEELGGSFTYVYGRLPFDVSLSASRFIATRDLRAESRPLPYREESVGGALTLSLPLPLQDQRHTLYATYGVRRFAQADPITPHHDPLDRAPLYPELGFFNSLTLGWSYATFDSYAFSISTERGFQIGVYGALRAPWLGSDHESAEFGYSSTAFVPNPWVDHHVLGLRLSGGFGAASYRRRGLFVIGGLPEQDQLTALLTQVPLGGVHLRGYEPGATIGDQYHLLNAEYRLPLYAVETGVATLPFYLRRLYGAAFVDYGGAFFGPASLDKLRLGVGAELRLSTTLGYFIPADLRLGYARGLDEGGFNHVYLIVGNQF